MRATFLAGSLLMFLLRASSEAAAPIKVACVGDSITQNSGWSDKLGAKLGAGLHVDELRRLGDDPAEEGRHPTGARAAVHAEPRREPGHRRHHAGDERQQAVQLERAQGRVRRRLRGVDRYVRALPSHPKIYLNLCPPAGTNGYQIVGSVIENEVIPDIKQVAAAKGLPTIDVFDGVRRVTTLDQSLYGSAGDLVHPNAKGAQVIADTVYAALMAAASDGGAGAGARRVARARGGSSKADASVDARARRRRGGRGRRRERRRGTTGGASGTTGRGGGGAAGATGAAGGGAGRAARGGRHGREPRAVPGRLQSPRTRAPAAAPLAARCGDVASRSASASLLRAVRRAPLVAATPRAAQLKVALNSRENAAFDHVGWAPLPKVSFLSFMRP